ncbi:hypothetical protein CR513_35704, partial [Mucuna pruriens]
HSIPSLDDFLDEQVCGSKDSLFANLDKCVFCTQEVTFLGFVVGSHGVKVDKEKFPNRRAMIVKDDGEVASDSLHGETSTSSECHVLGNLCSIIIDGGSCVNVSSERLVEVTFTLGKYEDKVLCDVVPMEATHLLLDRPRFSFVHMEQKVVLKPLSQRVAKEDQNKMR